MKKLIAVFILIILLLALSSCAQKMPDHLIAKVRYFDGSQDTLKIKSFKAVGDCLQLTCEDGHTCVVGTNNVIIIEDEDY